ncbi:hypothetical protein ACFLYX_02455 [Chloroflexota bacterium]
MAEEIDDLKKLLALASDLGYPVEIRANAIKSMGRISSHEALLALLSLAANTQLNKKERELALKYAGSIIKSGY